MLKGKNLVNTISHVANGLNWKVVVVRFIIIQILLPDCNIYRIFPCLCFNFLNLVVVGNRNQLMEIDRSQLKLASLGCILFSFIISYEYKRRPCDFIDLRSLLRSLPFSTRRSSFTASFLASTVCLAYGTVTDDDGGDCY